MTPLAALVIIVVAGLYLEGCSEEEEEKEGDNPDHIYKSVKPILDKNCVPCHNPTQALGNCDLSTLVKKTPDGYVGIVACPPELTILGQADHSSYLNEADRATVECWWNNDKKARFWPSGIHPPSFLNPKARDFHGEGLAKDNWKMAPCRSCHGEDWEVGGAYGGGKVAVDFGNSVQSCNQCHGGSPEGCTTCHGRGDNPAPPRSLRWDGSLGQAAHQSHLSENILSDPVPCETCHTVPERFDSATHIDANRPAEVTFGGLATYTYNGYSTDWNRTTASCSVYCHQKATPIWTTVDGSQKTCTSCHTQHSHGIVEASCSTCHPKVVDNTMTIVDRSLHVNGSVQVGTNGDTCDSCHDLEATPPKALDWPKSLGPAAHQSHTVGSGIASPIGCPECHTVPASPFDPGHIDTPFPAEVTFGGLAIYNGFSTNWNRETRSCSVYCHGTATPDWTRVDGSQKTCDSCHPKHSHGIIETSCSTCHPKVVDNTEKIINQLLHVNGSAQVGPKGVTPKALACDSCHDLEGDPAQAIDWKESKGPAAHKAHLKTPLTTPLTCEKCHVVPATLLAAGHIDSELPADVLPELGWNGKTGRCSDTSCHPSISPQWNGPAGVTTCISCHGAPPPKPHPQIQNCWFCHGSVVNGAGEIIYPDKHINGKKDL